jgi:hypothetical protein
MSATIPPWLRVLDGIRIVRHDDPRGDAGSVGIQHSDRPPGKRSARSSGNVTQAFSASNQSDYAWDVFVVNADGTDLRRLTDYPGLDADPTWSPDGSMIAFSSERATGPSQTEAQDGTPYVMNADGSGVRHLLDLEAVGLGDWTRAWITDWRSG